MIDGRDEDNNVKDFSMSTSLMMASPQWSVPGGATPSASPSCGGNGDSLVFDDSILVDANVDLLRRAKQSSPSLTKRED